MGGLGVSLGNGEVAFDHLEAGVAQEGLEGVDVATVADVGDGEGMPEAVGVDAGDAGALAEAVEVGAEHAAVVAVTGAGGEEGLIVFFQGVTGGEVVPDCLAGATAQPDEAGFASARGEAAFAQDGSGAGSEVDVADVEATEFAGADAGVEEDADQGCIAELLEVRQLRCGLWGVVPGCAVRAGVEEGGDLGAGEWFDHGLLGARDVDLAGEVFRGVAFVDAPGPEGAEAGVYVFDGFGAEGFGRAFGDAGRCEFCAQELIEEGAEVGQGDLFELEVVAEVGLESAEGEGVVADGVGAAAGDLFVEEEAGDRGREFHPCALL